VIVLYGLGRFDHGLVGDLSLVRLCAALHGRSVEAAETAALLARYGAWAGLASTHLAAHRLARPQRRDRARPASGRHRV
jgi:3-methyladenine DNA glycosylase/8-oxoguanine DNA glycosylase